MYEIIERLGLEEIRTGKITLRKVVDNKNFLEINKIGEEF